MEFEGKLYKKIYGEEKNYAVALYKPLNPIVSPDGKTHSYVKVAGRCLQLNEGVRYKILGEWEDGSKGIKGYIFKAVSFEEIRPIAGIGVIKYLTTIDGIGKKNAEKIYAAFGDNVFEILDNDFNRLKEVNGISEKTFNKAKACWLKRTKGKDFYSYLYSFSVPENVIMDIYDTYGDLALEIVKREPYSLLEFHGFGFKTADAIARKEGLPLYGEARLKAAIIESLKEVENSGSTCAVWSMLQPIIIKTLYNGLSSKERTLFEQDVNEKTSNAKNAIVERAKLTGKTVPVNFEITLEGILFTLCQQKMKRDLFIDEINGGKYIFRRLMAHKEMGIAKSVKALLRADSPYVTNADKDDVIVLLKEAVAKGTLPSLLTENQAEAVQHALNENVCIITGGPGTGKTFVEKAIMYALEQTFPGIRTILLAPTGRAARRMSESTGRPAHTIHSALGLYGGESESSSKMEMLDADVVIVDESSMVDTSLANILFSSVNLGTKIILVGDDKQLPSVGCGSVLRELLASKCIPTVTLKSVFRQAKGSSIGYNASRIIAGDTKMLEDESFIFIEAHGSDEIAEEVRAQYGYYSAKYGTDNVTVLTPYRKGETATCVNNMNNTLQKSVFPETKREYEQFITGDRVMFTKNENGLANGDIGTITKITRTPSGVSMMVDFGNPVLLDEKDIESLELAYATTVHKSQGSEYECVLIVMDPAHKYLHQRGIIYTALTRAKKKAIIIGSRDSFNYSVTNLEGGETRLSGLSHFLKKMDMPNNDVDATDSNGIQEKWDI